MTDKGKRFQINIGIIFGGLILLAGTLLLLDNLNIIRFDHSLWDFWPVIIILIGLSQLINTRTGQFPFFALFLTGLGVLLLLNELGQLNFDVWRLWPLAVIIIGFNIIRHHLRDRTDGDGKPKRLFCGSREVDRDTINISAILGGGEYTFSSKKLKGGKLTAIMGGGDIDLRNCAFESSEIYMDVFILMGGYEIHVPRDWNVIIRATPLLGGVDNKTDKLDDSGKDVIITGTIVMGGLEIKN